MEAEGKKRKKIINAEDEDQINDDDTKMEKFFALIRSAKDIRDRLLDLQGSRVTEKEKKKKEKKAAATDQDHQENNKANNNAAAAAWKPSFEPEDFPDQGVLFNRTPPASVRRSDDDDEDDDDDDDESKKADAINNNNNGNINGGRIELDLNLSL